jgi:GT2 family glycosyltransferase
MKISGSLVLYRSRKDQFETAIRNYLEAVPDGVLYVVDNSPTPLESELFMHARVIYLHNQENMGFGAAHNRAIRLACLSSDLHLILNPDIRFGAEVLDEIAAFFLREPKLVVAMPRIVYPDGSLQRLCKLLPTPMDLIARRFMPIRNLRQKLDYRYEMHELCQQRPSEVPTLSGCFLVARSDALIQVDGFDERYFMYMEDVDLVRRLAMNGKSLYVPTIAVVHEYAKGSYRNYRLLRYHIHSAIRYFNKWGWFVDSHRRNRNRFCSENMHRTSHTGPVDVSAGSGSLLPIFDPNQVEVNDLSR